MKPVFPNFYISHVLFIAVLLLVMVCHLALFWPGEMTPDSQTQYHMAVQGVYSDHHPFIMSWIWSQFYNFVYPGPGPMLVFHLFFFYLGVYFFSKAWAPYKWAALVLPFIPGILVYSGIIWKDVGMAFTYFCVAGYLSMITVQKHPLSVGGVAWILPVLVYGTAVKFQGMYLAPLMLVWMALLRSDYRWGIRFLGQGVLMGGSFYTLMALLGALSPPVQQDHSWQYVKIFDLAALSVKNQKDLFPDHTKTEQFSLPALSERFSSQLVDDLCFPKKDVPLLKKTDNAHERDLLWTTWSREVIKHPVDYLVHRFSVLSYALGGMAGWEFVSKFLSLKKGTWTYYAAKAVCFLFLAPFLTLCLGILYWGLGIWYWRYSPYAKALFMLTTLALTMVSILVFFSMAGTPRYVYISLCLIHGGHGLAYLCLQRSVLWPHKDESIEHKGLAH